MATVAGPDAVRTLPVLGCDGSFPAAGGAASGYLVQSATTSLLLDAGSGTFANLQRVLAGPSLDAGVLTHEHPDHWADIESLAVAGPIYKGEPIPLYCPAGIRDRSYFKHTAAFDWRTITAASGVTVGDLRLRFSRTDHGPETLAVCIATEGREDPDDLFVYSADTGPNWSPDVFGKGIGTFLCEATHLRDLEGTFQHLSGHQAGAMAKENGVRTLICTHRSPTVPADALVEEASAALGREASQAAMGKVFEW